MKNKETCYQVTSDGYSMWRIETIFGAHWEIRYNGKLIAGNHFTSMEQANRAWEDWAR